MEVRKIDRPDQETVLALSQFTLPQILFKQAKELGTKKIAIREMMYGIWQAYNWEDYFRYTKHVALGFFALGLKRGENIGIITDNHPEWLFSELGAQAIGAITVNFFTSSTAKELTTMLNRIQAAYVVAQDQDCRRSGGTRQNTFLFCRLLPRSRGDQEGSYRWVASYG